MPIDFDGWSMLGFATGAVELAWRYAQERTRFGKPICAHQSVRHDTVVARTQLQACRHRLYHAAWPAHEGRPCSVVTSMAKLFVGDTAVHMALKCEQVMGAYGTAQDHDMERYVRDLLLRPIVGGWSKMQKNSIAARLWLPEQRQDLAAARCSAARAVGPRGFASAGGAAGSARPDWLGAGIRFRLGPPTRLFDLPAPELSLRGQDGGQQCGGNEIDGRGTRSRPSAGIGERPIQRIPAARLKRVGGPTLANVHSGESQRRRERDRHQIDSLGSLGSLDEPPVEGV